MRYLVIILLLLGAHFSLTALVPGPAGKAYYYWPWAADSRPIVGFLEGSLKGVLTPLLSIIAGAAFVAALLALFGLLIPVAWWSLLMLVGSIASILLFLMYLGPLAILPLLIDAFLLYGLFVQGWNVAGLSGR